MSQIHPEICIMLVEKIIKEYGLKTMDEIPDEFKQVIADKKGKTIKDLDRREVLRLYNREPLRKLASVFRDAELNRLPILGSRSNDQFMRAYYSLMFLVMYIFNHATASIYVNQKGNYTIDAGGIGFVSSRRLLLLLFGYRLYIAGSKAGSTLKPEIQDYMLNRLKMETHLDDLPDSSYLSFYTYPEAFTKNLKLYSEQYGFDREPSFMLNPETIPAIAIFNESSISSRPETSQMLKLVNKHRAESGRILFYADPPYLASSVHYGSGWTEDLEAQLLQTLDHIHSSGNYFALSNVTDNTGLSNFMLKKWLIDHPEFKVKLLDKEYFAQRGTGAASFVTIEVLVTNYDFVDGKPFIELEGDIRAIFDNAGLQYDHFGIGGKTFTKKAFENE
jgi:hypothetical protein